MLPCDYRKKGWFTHHAYYCYVSNKQCGLIHWAWCRGIIIGIFLMFAIVYFFYGIVFAWQTAEDRVERHRVQQKVIFARKVTKINLTVTAYSPRKEETDSSPFITAFQKPVKAGIIAISRDLERLYGWKQGDIIELEGLGQFKVGDRMNRRWTKRVDIFHWFTYDAKQFGVRTTKGWKL